MTATVKTPRGIETLHLNDYQLRALRGYRGFVLHVLRPARKLHPMNRRRSMIDSTFRMVKDKPKGCCAWCRRPLDPHQTIRANFHGNCAIWMTIAKAQRQTPYRQWVIDRVDCPCGAPGDELDHIHPIMLAALGDSGEYARAFLPWNLQWLCVTCHREKTARDYQKIADSKAGRIRMELL